MIHYKKYTTEDLIQDEYFRRWVLRPAEDTSLLWEEFLSDYPEKQGDVIRARALLLAMHQMDQDPGAGQGDRIWGGILDRIETETQTERPIRRLGFGQFNRYWAYAAAMLVLGGAISWIVLIKDFGSIARTYEKQIAQTDNQLIEYVNQTKAASRLVLPDGSIVVLSMDSKVSYEKGFSSDQRRVYLSGQGYFEVEKNPQKPFLVFAGNVVTQVVGTRFTVNSTSGSSDISVSVRSGKVKVFTIDDYQNQKSDGSTQSVMLSANEQATFEGGKRLLTKGIAAKPEVLKAPVKFPDFNFERASMEDVFTTLGDSYGVVIEYDPKVIANCNLTAELGSEPLFKKLDIICRTIDATYEVWGTKIIIEAKGCNAF
ncbi:FecR family protein [Dyadobacter sp. NIV53]|uniref:FecR family protein n=1 Tax=Dyadobacter sp. NIV53 TaxID=2861765 RepID=UPI001C86F89E|nr:FecR family protein [Dyadobacter sp. NIV53]